MGTEINNLEGTEYISNIPSVYYGAKKLGDSILIN